MSIETVEAWMIVRVVNKPWSRIKAGKAIRDEGRIPTAVYIDVLARKGKRVYAEEDGRLYVVFGYFGQAVYRTYLSDDASKLVRQFV